MKPSNTSPPNDRLHYGTVTVPGCADGWYMITAGNGRVILKNKRTYKTRCLWEKHVWNGKLFLRNITDPEILKSEDELDAEKRLEAGVATIAEVNKYRKRRACEPDRRLQTYFEQRKRDISAIQENMDQK